MYHQVIHNSASNDRGIDGHEGLLPTTFNNPQHTSVLEVLNQVGWGLVAAHRSTTTLRH